VALSIVLHVLVIAMVIWATAEIAVPRGGAINDALVAASGGGGGGGQGGASYIAVAAPAATAVAAPAVPPEQPPLEQFVPPMIPPPVAPASVVASVAPDSSSGAASAAASAGTGGGSGGGVGTGAGPGTGSGVGPGSGGGTGGGTGAGERGIGPEPRQLIIPPIDAPKSLRGKTVAVTFVVAADGRVTDIEVVPPISDRGFSKKFDEVMHGYRFKPARDPSGQTIASRITVEVTF